MRDAMRDEDFVHRDGLVLSHCNSIRTSIAWKCDRRGTTINRTVLVGEADSDPDRIGQERRYVVLAIPGDVHHIVMEPDEADAMAKALTEEAARVREKRERDALYYAIEDEAKSGAVARAQRRAAA